MFELRREERLTLPNKLNLASDTVRECRALNTYDTNFLELSIFIDKLEIQLRSTKTFHEKVRNLSSHSDHVEQQLGP